MSLHLSDKDTFTGVNKKALWFGHIYKCVKAQYVEMCLYISVAKTHLPVLLKSTVGWKHI